MVVSPPLQNSEVSTALSLSSEVEAAESIKVPEVKKAKTPDVSRKDATTVEANGPKSKMVGGMNRSCCCGPPMKTCFLSWAIVLMILGGVQCALILASHPGLFWIIILFINPAYNFVVGICAITGVTKNKIKLLKILFYVTIVHIILLTKAWIAWALTDWLVALQERLVFIECYIAFYYGSNIAVTTVVCVLTKLATRPV